MRNMFYFAAAALAFGTAWHYYEDVSAQTQTVEKLRLIAAPGTVFEAGTVIDAEFIERHFVTQSIPAAIAGDYDWAIADTPAARSHLEDRTLERDVPAGSFLQSLHFVAERETEFTMRIPEGYRAFPVEVRGETASEGFTRPGSRVDVVGTFVADRDQPAIARTILENVIVMAAGTYDTTGAFEQDDRPEVRSVTLLAPMADVLHFYAESAAANGGLILVLRNPCEDVTSCMGETNLAALNGG